MSQQTFAEASFEQYRKPTRRERFLAEMEQVIPWSELAAVIEPYYPKAEGAGRPPVGVERMLRIHFLQHWFNLSDPAVEEALYDSRAMRQFVGIDLGREPVPDETTICKFRHLLEVHRLGEQLFALIRTYLAEQGLQISRGTIVDAPIISAPSSTKNRQKERDPEMHQTKKGNQWYFGMKAHIGVDSRTKLIHSVAATAANVHDSQVLPELLHGQETRVKGYAAHEKEVLENVTRARAMLDRAATPGQAAQADNMLTGALRSLFAVAEAYPDLKANTNFLELQRELTDTEDKIAYSRQYYNDNVTRECESTQDRDT